MAKGEKFSFPRRNSSSNFAMTKRNYAEGNFSDVKSDITINVDGVTFSLHKFPLLARSGRIRTLAAELKESDTITDSVIEFSNFPGGPDTFELATKFCYGINFDITTANVASLRCAAEYLEMTEEYGDENLISRTEAFLNEVVLQSVEKSAQVLHSCENILLLAEEVKIVNRCIDSIASKVCKEQTASSMSRLDLNSSGRSNNPNEGVPCKAVVEWWAEELSTVRIDLYQRAVAAMKSRGLRSESLGGALMRYAQRQLKSLLSSSTKGSKSRLHLESASSKAEEHEQRILLESIVSLLPAEKNIFPTNFLLCLLRSAVILDTTVACRLDLERRVGVQLQHATVDDILIPASSQAGDTLFDVDVVQRVLVTFLQQEEKRDPLMLDSDDLESPSHTGIMKVAKLIDMYLAEIAADANLKVSKFTSLAEQLPDYARVLDDGLYRAIDIFLKAHPSLSDLERKKLCKLLDCQRLSQEACAHAAQNERLPVQMVVQVLYFEQLRMRKAMALENGNGGSDQEELVGVRRGGGGGGGAPAASPRVDSWGVRRENRELRMEVARIRIRVQELEKENAALKQELVDKPPVARGGGGFFGSFSRRLGKMNLFSSHKPANNSRGDGSSGAAHHNARRRRHSIS